MQILYLTLGTHPAKGYIDIRWKYSGSRGFAAAFGPVNHRSLWRAVKWFFKRDRTRRPVFRRGSN